MVRSRFHWAGSALIHGWAWVEWWLDADSASRAFLCWSVVGRHAEWSLSWWVRVWGGGPDEWMPGVTAAAARWGVMMRAYWRRLGRRPGRCRLLLRRGMSVLARPAMPVKRPVILRDGLFVTAA
jgi:hypothetical protein